MCHTFTLLQHYLVAHAENLPKWMGKLFKESTDQHNSVQLVIAALLNWQ